MDLNRESEKGLILNREGLANKVKHERKNSTDCLVSPTTHLFPLLGQSGSHGVSIKISLKPQIRNMEMIINKSILPCKLELC